MDEFALLRRQRYRDAGLIAIGLAALAVAIVLGGWAWRLERVVYDLGMSLSARAATQDIVIVAIDDQSLVEIGIWPWRRVIHATLLDRLRDARPRAVFLDLLLSEPDSDPRQDAALAQALRAIAPVILPVAWFAPPGAAPASIEPVPVLRDASMLAQAEADPDSDGILRHVFLRAGLGQADLPHVAVALLEAGGEKFAAHTPVALAPRPPIPGAMTWVRDRRLPIRFQGPPGHLQRVSYVDVLRGAVAPEVLRGKYVLVGMTAVGMGDAYATPMGGRQGEMPGIEIVGQVLQSLRAADTLRTPPQWLVATLSAALVFLLLALFARMRQAYALGLALIMVAAAAIGSVALVGAGWWVTPVGFVGAALLAYPLWSWRRLEVNAKALTDELDRLDADSLAPVVRDRHGMAMHTERSWSAFKEAAERLRRARRFLAAGLDGLSGPVLLADFDGVVILANRRAAELFEVGGPDELAGLSLPRLLNEFSGAKDIDWPSRLKSVAEGRSALSIQLQMAGHGDFLVSAVPAPDIDGPRLIVTCADISPIKEAQRQREEALAFVTHDLRSPLVSIALLADMYQRGLQPLQPDAMMREVRQLANNALSLSEQFVRAAQSEFKPLDLVTGNFDQLVRDVLREITPQARARAITLRYDAAAGERTTGRFDRELLHRAVANLLTNAIKFSPHDSIVTVTLETQPTGHLIRVQDEGPGISPEQLSSVFGAYSRAGADPAKSGVGLGLQFVQRVAERHGGSIRVDSLPGQGACFELLVPTR